MGVGYERLKLILNYQRKYGYSDGKFMVGYESKIEGKSESKRGNKREEKKVEKRGRARERE